MTMRKLLAPMAALLLLAGSAHAANVKVFVGGAFTPPTRVVSADFSAKTKNTVEIVSDTTGNIQKRLRAGEKADVVIVTQGALDALIKEKLADANRADLATALIGVGIHKSAKAPDISTPDAFKASLLAAKSVAYVSPAAGGTSGTYFEGLLQKFGIADAMKPKTVYETQGSEVAEAVATGKAELGITFGAEMLPNKDVTVAGYLPDSIQLPTIYSGAITASPGDAKAAQDFLASLQTPAASAAMTKAGLEPLKK